MVKSNSHTVRWRINMASKIWKIKGYEGTFSDEQLITLIKQGKLKGSDAVSTREIKKWIKIENSIYQYYLTGGSNETI